MYVLNYNCINFSQVQAVVHPRKSLLQKTKTRKQKTELDFEHIKEDLTEAYLKMTLTQ